MCGIVGLYLKNAQMQGQLGQLFSPLLVEMTDRGPDSAGIAVFRDAVSGKQIKFTVFHPDPTFNWSQLAKDMGQHSRPKSTSNTTTVTM